MPKIRRKIKEVSNNDYVNPVYNSKSGILTKSYKNILDKDSFDQGTIPTDKVTTGDLLNDYNELFNDNNTAIFSENTDINATLRIPASFLQKLTSEENKIFHSPNTFNEISGNTLTSPVNDTFKSSYYDDVFYENNFLIEYTPYQENKTDTIFEKLEVNQSTGESIADSFKTESSFIDSLEENYEISNQTAIEIELDFSNSGPAYLQNNRIWLDSNKTDRSSNITFSDVNKTFPAHNTPAAYYNFKNNRWDYIGGSRDFAYSGGSLNAYPPGENYRPTEDEKKEYSKIISESNIAFSPSFNLNDNIYDVSTPCFNSKFPIGFQWFGQEDNLLKLENYITGDFLLEKVVFECNDCESISNKNNVSYNGPFSDYYYQNSEISYLSNALTFFILKQTKGLNPSSFFESSGLDIHKKYRNDLYFEISNSNNDPVNFTENSTLIYDYLGENNDSTVDSYVNLRNHITQNDGHSLMPTTLNAEISKRQLITSSTFFIYNNGLNQTSKLTSILNTNKHIDSHLHVSSDDNINSTFSIKLKNNCNTFNKNDIHNTHIISNVAGNDSDVLVFSNNYLGGKDLQGNTNLNIINKENNNKIKSISLFNKNINSLSSSTYDSPVVLKPTDELILGVNSYSNGNIQPYMFILKNKVKVTLIGRHLQDNQKINFSKEKKSLTSKSIRKVIENKVLNEYNINTLDEINGSYIDKVYENTIDISNINNSNILELDSIGKLSSKLYGSFSNTKTSYNNKEVIYDSLLPSIFEYIENFTFNDINLSNNVLTLNYNNNNNEWLETFPYKESYNNNSFSTENRNSKILNKIKEIDNILVDVSDDQFIDHSRLYQYINLIDYSSPSFIRSFGNQSIKENIYQNNKNIYKVYKNVRGFIETNDLSIENNLNFLTQGKAHSIEIPTNIYADIVVWKNTLKVVDEIPQGLNNPDINDYYFAQITKLTGETFIQLPSSATVTAGSYTFPNDEDNLNTSLSLNREYRLVFYNPEVVSDYSTTSYKYNNSNNLEHLPHKLISRTMYNNADENNFDGYLNATPEWEKITEAQSGRSANKIYYLEKERNISIRRIETIMTDNNTLPTLSDYDFIDFDDTNNTPDICYLVAASFKIYSLVSSLNYLNNDQYTIPSIKPDGTFDLGSISTFTFTNQTGTWTTNEINQGYKASGGNALILIGNDHRSSLINLKNAINNLNTLNTYNKLYSKHGSQNVVTSPFYSFYGISLHQAYEINNLSNMPSITETIATQTNFPVSFNNFSVEKYFYKYEGQKTLTLSDYDNEVDTVNKVNTLFFGFSNKKGTSYKRHPLERVDGWKFGVYSGIKNYIKKRFNWKKFGQFADMENGSQNFAIFKEDGSVSRTIVKTFYDSYYYPIDTTTASNDVLSAMNTYNKDPYARQTIPYIES